MKPTDEQLGQFAAARAHYRKHAVRIASCPKDEWALEMYAWEHEAGIRLTPIERCVWADIRQCNAVMYPQFPVGRYIVDFANPAARVVLECDGAAWHGDAERDQRRQAEIESLGWTVYRLTGRECLEQEDWKEDEDGRAAFVRSTSTDLLRRIVKNHSIAWSGRMRLPSFAGLFR